MFHEKYAIFLSAKGADPERAVWEVDINKDLASCLFNSKGVNKGLMENYPYHALIETAEMENDLHIMYDSIEELSEKHFVDFL